MLIAIEGVSGVGKSRCSQALAGALKEQGRTVVLLDDLMVRDDFALAIRDVTHAERHFMTPIEELLVYCARLARKALLIKRVRAENEKAIIIVDRFTVSVIAYSAYVRGVCTPAVRFVTDLAAESLSPDLTVLLVADMQVAARRSANKTTRKMQLIAPLIGEYRRSFPRLVEEQGLEYMTIDTGDKPPDRISWEIMERVLGLEQP